jgi:hypothetical protein
MYDLEGTVEMTAGNKRVRGKHLLHATGRHHLETLELESSQAGAKKNTWNYNEFVARLLEVITVLRTRDK